VEPLQGVRVVDLTRVISGPFSTRLLHALGAEVVKVENPHGGDDARSFAPFWPDGRGVFFSLLNAGKRSIALDLKQEAARGILLRLVREADVLVDNFAPGTLERLGLPRDLLAAENPRLVQVGISGFGSGTALSGRPAYDATIQALSGLMQATGFPDSEPLLLGEAVVDQITALYAVIAIQSALMERERTGEGRHIDLSMFDALLATMTEYMSSFAGGRTPSRSGNRHPISAPYNCYRCQNGYVVIAAANDRLFERLAEAVGRRDWLADPRYASDSLRRENVEALDRDLGQWTESLPAEEVERRIARASVPCALVQDVGQATRMLSELGRPNRVPLDGPTALALPVLPWVATGDAAPLGERAPALGQDTRDILDRQGLDDPAIAALARSGAVAGPDL